MTWQDYTDAATPGRDFDPTDAEIESGWPECDEDES